VNHELAHASARALLGACLLSDRAYLDASQIIDGSDFTVAEHTAIWDAITATYEAGERIDVLTVQSRCPNVSLADLNALTAATPSVSGATKYATHVADHRLRQRLINASAEIANAANTASDAAHAADRARELVAHLDMPIGKGAPDLDVDTFIANTDTTYDWLIPDVLECRDRLLVTASEGAGKSTLLAQIGVQLAAGIHPWTGQPIPARNVLIIDLENPPRLVTRRIHRLREAAGPNLDPRRLRILTKPEGIDLTARSDVRWLIDRCEANRAELLVIGPAYRMSSGVAERGDVGGEDAAKRVTRALDEVRIRANVALLLETHAPHGDARGARDLRPFGSSVWLRWPEFGIGLRSTDPEHRIEYTVEHWRGPRDVRQWPLKLKRNAGRWLWTPVMPTGTFRSAA